MRHERAMRKSEYSLPPIQDRRLAFSPNHEWDRLLRSAIVLGPVCALVNSLAPATTAERFSCVPSMFDSLGVRVPYPT
jgi:hypothetical protein